MARLSVPIAARLPSSLRVDTTNATAVKLLNRLSRPSLLSLVQDWLADGNQTICPPHLRDEHEDDDDTDDFYPPVRSLEELRELYSDMQLGKGSRREVVDRIVEGDWRNGLSLYQLAMADIQYLYDHPGSLKWTGFKIERLKMPKNGDDAEGSAKVDKQSLEIPRFHPSTFLQNLQAEVLPDVKAHYTFDRPKDLALLLLRIFIIDSPYNTGLAVSNRTRERAATSFDASRTIYIAFPDASPHLYISKSQSTGSTASGESRSLRSLVVEGVPKALSRPRERFALKSTNISTKNLSGLLHAKGAGRGNGAAGGWSIYAEDDRTDSALNPIIPTPPLSDSPSGGESSTGVSKRKRVPGITDARKQQHERDAKRARTAAQARFGNSAKPDDGRGVERLDIVIEDPFPSRGVPAAAAQGGVDGDGTRSRPSSRRSKGRRSGVNLELERAREDDGEEEDDDDNDDGSRQPEDNRARVWRPMMRFTFQGSHVFAGIRQLVEAGIINGEKMPGWLTGEENVTIGAVRNGRIRGQKGSGL
ncbi:trfA protein [Xylariales sp. PMI_506]|nr:trfA protein [Xylariales sp. PMI_506]